MTIQDFPHYEVYAVRYGEHVRHSRENFLGGDPHDGPMPMAYYVWAIVGAGQCIVVDTGFDAATAQRRNRKFLQCPGQGLRMIGIEPTDVEHVIISHMHYDHAGNHDLFANATFHVQDREMRFTTGRHMCQDVLRAGFDVDDVIAMLRRLFSGRVRFHDGDEEIAPGISVHYVGGHTMGSQVVRVMTRQGWLVLASDACPFFASRELGLPFPAVFDVGEMLQGYERVRDLASADHLVIPGHDALVLDRYQVASPELSGLAMRLDADPINPIPGASG